MKLDLFTLLIDAATEIHLHLLEHSFEGTTCTKFNLDHADLRISFVAMWCPEHEHQIMDAMMWSESRAAIAA